MIRDAIDRARGYLRRAIARAASYPGAGYMRHRGVLIVHMGMHINETAVANAVDFVSAQIQKNTNAATADRVRSRTIVVLLPNETFTNLAGITYQQAADEYRGAVLPFGLVRVACGGRPGQPEAGAREHWQISLTRGLARLWAQRAGISRREPGQEWAQ